jgi:uncharacterized membrane protein YecN with MAPEG domain
VSLTRGSSNTVIGYNSSDPTDRLHKLCRAHGNAAEYVPIMAVLMLIAGARNPSTWMIWTFIAATAFRYCHAAGMVLPASLAQPNPLRFVGALGTYVAGIALVVAALLRANP